MCGFIGKISFKQFSEHDLESNNNNIVCRGPDTKKTIFNKVDNINFHFIFNRLAILDLSEQANQPMYSEDFNTLLMFNGEIFNHDTLRGELKNSGINFKTKNSDSEVLLKGLSFQGESFIQKIIGQFSIAFFNFESKKLLLARDRLGQKPLYYFIDDQSIVFGSNYVSVLNTSKKKNININQVHNYLNFGIVPSTNLLHKGMQKLDRAEILEVNFNNSKIEYVKKKYWNILDYEGNQKFNGEEFFALFTNSVQIRNQADVPVGNFLSGGIDSTSIIKNQFDNNINSHTFTVGVEGSKKYDESVWANQVVEKYKTNHKLIKISSSIDTDKVFNSLSSLDEPYADPSIVPSYLISKEISKYFKVAISGDGGDELFGGYQRTLLSLKKHSKFISNFSKLYNIYPSFLGTGSNLLKYSNDSLKINNAYLTDLKLLNLLKIKNPNLYEMSSLELNSDYKSLLYSDYNFYLPDQMLYKVDRSSMANSLEVRSPFVDHRLVEYIFGHTTEYFNSDSPKSILKNYLSSDFDNKFLNRPKQGFVFNIEDWIYNNLNIIHSVLNEGEIIKNLNKNIIKTLTFKKSRINALRIWKIFVLEYYLTEVCKD